MDNEGLLAENKALKAELADLKQYRHIEKSRKTMQVLWDENRKVRERARLAENELARLKGPPHIGS